MKLITLGLLFSALNANHNTTYVDLDAENSGPSINANCNSSFRSYGNFDVNPVKGRKYRIGYAKKCGGKWSVGFMHWKNYSHGWPGSIFPTGSWGVAQDTKCNARNKAYIRQENDGRWYDDERSKRYAYSDSSTHPWQSGSAMCTIVDCYNDFQFVNGDFSINVNGKVYKGLKWKKGRAHSSRQWMDLRCSGDEVYSTRDIRESFFFLLY